MEPLRVLFVYQCLAHYRAGVFDELQKAEGHRCEFAADVRSKDDSIPTIPTSFFESFHLLRSRWLGRALWQHGLLPLLLKRRYDCVVFLGDASHLASWAGALLCRMRRTPVLYWTIGWRRPESGLKRQIRLAFYRLANRLLLYGNAGRAIGSSVGYPPRRMTVIGNSYPSRTEPAGTTRGAEIALSRPLEGRRMLTAVIRLNPEKRLDMLLRAAARLGDQGMRITVLLAGEGPESGRLQHLARELNVDLEMTGAIYDAEHLARIYAITDVTVVPSSIGLTAIQSLMYGRPVVTTNNADEQGPEYEAVRPGITGGLYQDGSLESLAENIADWLGRTGRQRDEIARSCRAEVETNWSPAVHAARILSAIEKEMVASRHRI